MLCGSVLRGGESSKQSVNHLLHLLLLRPAQCDEQPVAVLFSQRLHLFLVHPQQRVALQRPSQVHLSERALQLHAAVNHAAQRNGAAQLALCEGYGICPLRRVHVLNMR